MTGGSDTAEDPCRNYKTLLSNIKMNDTSFNSEIKDKTMKVTTMSNIVVDSTNEKERRVFILQYANTTQISSVYLGTLVIDLTTGERLFMLNQSSLKNHSSKVDYFFIEE